MGTVVPTRFTQDGKCYQADVLGCIERLEAGL